MGSDATDFLRSHFERPIPSFAVNFYVMHFFFKKKVPHSNHFIAGGVAGCVNALKNCVALQKTPHIAWISPLFALLWKGMIKKKKLVSEG